MASLIPRPASALWPDGGQVLFDLLEEPYAATQHEGEIVRIWRLSEGWESHERPYYPIAVKDMTDDELNRSIGVAVQMLELPQNRKARRKLQSTAKHVGN